MTASRHALRARAALALALPLLLALAVRVVGLDHGEGLYVFHPDMAKQLRVATRVYGGHENVRGMYKEDFELEIYPYGNSILAGRAARAWHEVTGQRVQTAEQWGWDYGFRIAVVAGALLVQAALALLLLRAAGPGAALAGGLLLAVEPLHAELSHYGMNDVPMLGLLLLAWLAALTLHRDRGNWAPRALAAGGLLGLAFGVKYQALLGGVFLLVPWLVHLRERGLRWAVTSLAWAAVGGVAGVLFTCPLLLHEPAYFLEQFPVFMRWQSNITDLNFTLGQKLANNLPGLALDLLAHGRWLLLAPTAWTVWRVARRDTPAAERAAIGSALAFCAVLAAALVSSRDLVRDNDLLPLLPFLVLAAVWAAARLPVPAARRAAAAALAAFGLWSAAESIPDSLALARPDTRIAALEWCNAHIRSGSVVRREQYTVRPAVPVVDRSSRYLCSPEIQRIIDEGHFDYLITSSLAHQRFFDPHFHGETAAARAFYRELPRRFHEAARFADRELMFAHPTIAIYTKRPAGQHRTNTNGPVP